MDQIGLRVEVALELGGRDDSLRGLGVQRQMLLLLGVLLVVVALLRLLVVRMVDCDRLIHLFHLRSSGFFFPKPKQSLPLAQTQGRLLLLPRPVLAVYQISATASAAAADADNQIFV